MTDIINIKTVLHIAHKQNKRLGFVFPAYKITTNMLGVKMRRNQFYVLVINEKIAGTIAIKKTPTSSEIGSLAVVPKFQENGFGKMLLRFAEKKLISLGAHKVTLTTPRNHPFLPKYYRKKGYVPMKNIYNKHSKWLRLEKKVKPLLY